MRWALVTGTSSGLGRSMAARLMREGVSVFAGVRRRADGDTLARELTSTGTHSDGAPRLVPLLLDVTSDEQIQTAISEVSETVGADGLWALVNNAGIVVGSPIEYLTSEQWRRQFNANVFGVADLTRAALPLLRQAVAIHGVGSPRVMIVSSIGGRVAQPMIGAYTSSKCAVTAIGLSLRMELRRHGIGVTVFEPGGIATAIWEKGDQQVAEFTDEHPAMRYYRPEIEGMIKLSRTMATSAMPADRAAEMAVRSLMRKHAPARVLAGIDAKIMALLLRALPYSWFESFLMKQYGIPKPPELAPNARLKPALDPAKIK
jgi:NAD(P)-dependent dehydrogenase (short-subunit alcohol dehydrogenase family)